MMSRQLLACLILLMCFFVIPPYTFAAFTLIQFKEMTEYITGRVALDYVNYGNFCGLGGSGEPVDQIDRCCQNHDACYDGVGSDECKNKTLPVKAQGYQFEKLRNRNVSCSVNNLLMVMWKQTVLCLISFMCFIVIPQDSFAGFTLVRFKQMIEYITERFALDFNNYGSYCGFGGSGEPVDEIDRCCQVHDNCYTRVEKNECKSHILPIYAIGYRMKKLGNHKVSCERNTKRCRKAICECDKTCAECFARNDRFYNRTHRRFLG